MKPIHQHDCDRCTFIGTDTTKRDWYVCSLDQGGSGSVIQRYSSVPSENHSYPISIVRNSNCLISPFGDPYTELLNIDLIIAKHVLDRFIESIPKPEQDQKKGLWIYDSLGRGYNEDQINAIQRELNARTSGHVCYLPAGTHHAHFYDDCNRLIGSFNPRG